MPRWQDVAILALNMPIAKRVLLIVTQADWGGVQSFLIQFAAGLMAEGRTVLLAAGGEGELWTRAKERGIPCHQLRHVGRELSFQDFIAVHELENLIKEFKPDAIHLNSSKIGVLGSLAANQTRTGARVVYRIGGWAFLEPMAEWKRTLYRQAEKWTAGLKDTIITVNPSDEVLAHQLGFKARGDIRTVANGLDVAAFVSRLKTRHDARTTLGLAESDFVFGTIANVYPAKALDAYLENIKTLLDQDASIRIVIVGGGIQFEELKAKRDQLGLQNRVLLPGQLDAPTLYSAFDVFVLPSKKEGMPWTVLEAMASGIPCLTTDVGACRWMLEEPDHINGLVVPVADGPPLVQAMRSLKNDPTLRERLATAGKTAITRRFTWESTYRGNRDALDGM